jgi:hypothetical protein
MFLYTMVLINLLEHVKKNSKVIKTYAIESKDYNMIFYYIYK